MDQRARRRLASKKMSLRSVRSAPRLLPDTALHGSLAALLGSLGAASASSHRAPSPPRRAPSPRARLGARPGRAGRDPLTEGPPPAPSPRRPIAPARASPASSRRFTQPEAPSEAFGSCAPVPSHRMGAAAPAVDGRPERRHLTPPSRSFPLRPLFPVADRRGVAMLRSLSAGVAQLVEHELPKLGVVGSSPISRSGRDAVQRLAP